MNRRHLITAAAALSVPGAGSHREKRHLRTSLFPHAQRSADLNARRTFFSKYYLPAAQRLNIGPLGFFNAIIAEQSPFLLALASYPSIAAMDTAMEKMAADKEFQKGFDEYNSMSELGYIRMESSLLRAFDSIPEHRGPASRRQARAAYFRAANLRIQ